MTGYGMAEKSYHNKNITVEIRSLNSKQGDINMKVPAVLKEKELELRRMIVDQLERGKINCLVYIEHTGTDQAATINIQVVKSYIKQIKRLSEDMRISFDARLLQTALQMPEAFQIEEESPDQEEWQVISQTMEEALLEVVRFRSQEGEAIEHDFRNRIQSLKKLLEEVEPHEKARTERIRERLQEKLKDFRQDFEVDQNRFEQELVYYLEKLDITDRKSTRLNSSHYS